VRRRKFIALIGGAGAWPLAARGQQSAVPVVGFMSSRSPEDSAHLVERELLPGEVRDKY